MKFNVQLLQVLNLDIFGGNSTHPNMSAVKAALNAREADESLLYVSIHQYFDRS